MMITKEFLIETLKAEIVEVTFTKVDGSERVMRCTLREDTLPARPVQEEKPTRKVSDDVLPVWDLDNNSWRSFRIDSVTKVERLHNAMAT